MSLREAYDLLWNYQLWRSGMTALQCEPSRLTLAITVILKHLEAELLIADQARKEMGS